MNILVTGAGGFLGSNLLGHLGTKHNLVALYHDRFFDASGACEPVPNDIAIRGDITDFPRMLEIIVDHEIDLIYHLASKAIVRNCLMDPVGCLRANVIGTATVLEAARRSERVQGIVVAESDKAYGPGPVPYREDQALMPQAIYEASKACTSHVCAAYWHNYGLPVATVRACNVYGEADPNRSRLVPRTILRLLEGEQPQITVGADAYRREWIYVGDACEGYTRIMEAQRWGEAFNLGTGEIHTVGDVVKLICEAMGKPDAMPEEWAKPSSLMEIQDQYLSLDKLRTIWPDFEPATMAETLPQVIEWYRENR
jgi:nucleoside-diphosphate-sugar epimerase